MLDGLVTVLDGRPAGQRVLLSEVRSRPASLGVSPPGSSKSSPIYVYFGCARPFLEQWATHYDHLREVTRADIGAALGPLHRTVSQNFVNFRTQRIGCSVDRIRGDRILHEALTATPTALEGPRGYSPMKMK